MFINRGRIVLTCSMEEFEARYAGSDRAPRARGRGAGAEADPRASGVRPQHAAVRARRIAGSSQRSAKCARPASPTYSSPSSAMPAAPHRRGGADRDDHRFNCNAGPVVRTSGRRLTGLRTGGALARSPLLLVGAARVVGKPLHLHRAADRRGRGPVRVRDRRRLSAALRAGGASPRHAGATPLNFALFSLMLTYVILTVVYCLGALHNERSDRSILFWKSLPVSDVTTVIAKASIPILILPLITFVVLVVTQGIMLIAASAAAGEAASWTQTPIVPLWTAMLYHLLTVHALYYAPIYGWLLLVSAWARRAPILWASLPVAAILIVERLIFNTSAFGHMLVARLGAVRGPSSTRRPGTCPSRCRRLPTWGHSWRARAYGSDSRYARCSWPRRFGCAGTRARSDAYAVSGPSASVHRLVRPHDRRTVRS